MWLVRGWGGNVLVKVWVLVLHKYFVSLSHLACIFPKYHIHGPDLTHCYLS